MFKKFMCVFLSCITLTNLSIPAVAFQEQNDSIVLTDIGHGEYTTMSVFSDENDLTSIQATPFMNDDVLQVSADSYLTKVGSDTYQLTHKVDLLDSSGKSTTDYPIPENIINRADEIISEALENGNSDIEVFVLVPEKIDASSRSVKSEETSYYEYNGKQMKDYKLIARNHNTGFADVSGKRAKATATKIKDFLITSAGMASKAVSLFSLGMSAYDVFVAAYGPVRQEADGDILEAAVIYDTIVKYTYMKDPAGYYQEGCVSYKAWVNKATVYQFYEDNGEEDIEQVSINEEYFSENYDDPAPVACDHWGSSWIDPPIVFEFHDTKFIAVTS